MEENNQLTDKNNQIPTCSQKAGHSQVSVGNDNILRMEPRQIEINVAEFDGEGKKLVEMLKKNLERSEAYEGANLRYKDRRKIKGQESN